VSHQCLISQLQSVLKAAARLIFAARKTDWITPLLEELYWLWMPERIIIRLYVLAYRCLHGTAPAYIAESLQLSSTTEDVVISSLLTLWNLLVPVTRCRNLGDVHFLLRLLEPRKLSRFPSDFLLCLLCFVAILSLSCSIVIAVCDCFVKCPSNSIAIMQLYNLNIWLIVSWTWNELKPLSNDHVMWVVEHVVGKLDANTSEDTISDERSWNLLQIV